MGLKALDYESINENMKKVEYAVRGELYLRASQLQKEGKKVFIPNLFFLQIPSNPTWSSVVSLFSLL